MTGTKFETRQYEAVAESIRVTYMRTTNAREALGVQQTAKDLASAFRASDPDFDAESWFATIYRDFRVTES
ncbi:hypothetical protein [Streptomyces griseus]|uniref:hypothetical protein n=1 Tax=Streptomyces griseus TaxID=1911 RepID=UPI00340CB465